MCSVSTEQTKGMTVYLITCLNLTDDDSAMATHHAMPAVPHYKSSPVHVRALPALSSTGPATIYVSGSNLTGDEYRINIFQRNELSTMSHPLQAITGCGFRLLRHLISTNCLLSSVSAAANSIYAPVSLGGLFTCWTLEKHTSFSRVSANTMTILSRHS